MFKIHYLGFARHLEAASLAETLCGSPLYMAPETYGFSVMTRRLISGPLEQCCSK